MKLLIFLIAATLGAQTKDFNLNMRVLGTLDTTGSTATKPFRTVSSDQSGSCAVPNEAVLNSLNGKVFVCAVSTWAQISASGTPSFDPQAANRIFAGPATGADSVPAFRALVAADMPATYMPNTRLINTASPLGGGGALTGDLTLTCSTCIISSGSYGDPAWLTSLDASKVTGTLGSVTLTNGTGLPVSTGISGLGTGVATFLATPSSANLASAVTNETGTGALVFATDPTFTLTDVTTNNATTSQHGWLPKLGGGTSNFLRADGTWAAPSGSGDVVASGTNTYSGYNNFSGGSMRWPEKLIADLPSASSNTGKVYVVTNAFSSTTGCGTAGGSARVPCISDGSAWVPLSLVTTNGTGIGSVCSGNTCTFSVQHAGVNAQTGTTYTISDSDRAKLITGTNASAQAYTLPQAGGSSQFAAGWFTDIQNRGAGAITITPAASTIDGASSLVLYSSQGVRLFSDGTNYYTQRGAVDSTVTITAAGFASSSTAAGEYKMYEASANGSNYVSWGAPSSLAADTKYLVPSTPPSGSQVLQCGTPSAGVSTCTWASGGSVTKVPVPVPIVSPPANVSGTFYSTGNCKAPASSASGSNDLGAYSYAFPNTSTPTLECFVLIPGGWDGAAVSVKFVGGGNTPGSGSSVRFAIKTGCVADGSAISSPTYGTATNLDLTSLSGGGNQKSATLALTLDSSCSSAAGKGVWVQIQRPNSGSDDWAANYHVIRLNAEFMVTLQ